MRDASALCAVTSVCAAAASNHTHAFILKTILLICKKRHNIISFDDAEFKNGNKKVNFFTNKLKIFLIIYVSALKHFFICTALRKKTKNSKSIFVFFAFLVYRLFLFIYLYLTGIVWKGCLFDFFIYTFYFYCDSMKTKYFIYSFIHSFSFIFAFLLFLFVFFNRDSTKRYDAIFIYLFIYLFCCIFAFFYIIYVLQYICINYIQSNFSGNGVECSNTPFNVKE